MPASPSRDTVKSAGRAQGRQRQPREMSRQAPGHPAWSRLPRRASRTQQVRAILTPAKPHAAPASEPLPMAASPTPSSEGQGPVPGAPGLPSWDFRRACSPL